MTFLWAHRDEHYMVYVCYIKENRKIIKRFRDNKADNKGNAQVLVHEELEQSDASSKKSHQCKNTFFIYLYF